MIWLVIILVLIVTFIIYKNSNKTETSSFKLDNLRHLNNYELIELIKTAPINKYGILYYELLKWNKLKNPIIMKAIDFKRENKNIDLDYFHNKIKQSEVRNNEDYSFFESDRYSFVENINVAGIHINDRKNNVVFECQEGDAVYFEAEPDNIFDSNAIKILWNNKVIGYVPKHYIYIISPIISNCKAIIFDIIIEKYGFVDCKISVYKKKES